MENNESLISNDLQVDPTTHAHLSETVKWAKFIAIAGFIFSVSILLIAVYYAILMSKVRSSFGGSGLQTSAILVFVFFIIFAIAWSLISLFQFRFATKLQVALQVNDQVEFNNAFQNLKAYYRVTGVVTIIVLIFTILGLIGLLSKTGGIF